MPIYEQPAHKPPLTLDALVARSARPARTPKRKPEPPFTRKLRDIEADSRISLPALDREAPRALVLITIETTCETCGLIHVAPNRNMLVRYDDRGLSHAVKHTKHEVEQFLYLPRERKLYRQTTPFCERCF